MEGWVKFHRKSYDNFLYKENRPHTRREAWEDMIALVNFEDKFCLIGNSKIECKRGQSLMSLDSWGKLFNWDKSKVKRFFDLLKKENMILIEDLRKTTRITICKYDDYQSEQNTNETPAKRQRNASETPAKPTKECKECKEEKEDIEERSKIFYDEIAKYKNSYTREMLRNFYEYWIEPNKSKTQMRFEMQKTWDLNKRLKRWSNNEKIIPSTSNSLSNEFKNPSSKILN